MNGKGIVIATEGIMAKVRVDASSDCAGCLSKSQCHVDNRKPRDISVINDYGANVSDAVFFEADAWKIIVSATLIWIMPVVAMIVGYLIAQRFAGGVIPVVAAFSFLALSFVVLRIIDRAVTGGRTFYPAITRILTPAEYADIHHTDCQ